MGLGRCSQCHNELCLRPDGPCCIACGRPQAMDEGEGAKPAGVPVVARQAASVVVPEVKPVVPQQAQQPKRKGG